MSLMTTCDPTQDTTRDAMTRVDLTLPNRVRCLRYTWFTAIVCFVLTLPVSDIAAQTANAPRTSTPSTSEPSTGSLQDASEVAKTSGKAEINKRVGEGLRAVAADQPNQAMNLKGQQVAKNLNAEEEQVGESGTERSQDQTDIPTATWVSLDESGGFTARIFDLGDQAEFRLQTDGVVFLTEVNGDFQFLRLDATGKIAFKDVQPGIHMITFIAPGRFLVSAVHAVASSPTGTDLFPTRIDLWCVNYGKREVDSIVLPYLTKGTAGSRPEVDLEKVERISEIRRTRRNGIDTIQDVQDIPSVFLVNGGISGTAYRPGTSEQAGQLLDPLGEADILLVGEEEVYSTIKTDKQGRFRFNAIEPGPYALLCTSNGGIAAIGMVVLDPEADAPLEDAGLPSNASYRYVLQGGGGGSLALQTSPNVSLLSASAAAQAAAGSSSSSSSSSAGQSAASAASATAATTLSEIAAQSEIPTVNDNTAEPDTDPDIDSNAAPPQ